MSQLQKLYGLGMGMGLVILSACGAGTTSSSATTTTATGTTLTGNLAGGTAGLSRFATTGCEADTVIVTNTAAVSASAAVAEDCSFDMELDAGSSYIVSFAQNDEFVATLIFDNGTTGFTSSLLPIRTAGEIDLGTVNIAGGVATPTNEPLDQIDNDSDGLTDLEDADDDNDGTEDEEESDCDLDGATDDMDEDDDECESEATEDDSARVLEIKPRNDPQIEEGDDTVDLDKEIRIRINCLLNTESVTEETISVISGEHAVACDFEFSDSHSGRHHVIKCAHDEDRFLADSVYTITIDGLLCEDSTAVAPVTVSFRTDASDEDGEDNVEDELDDEDELEAEEDAEDDSSSDDNDDDDDEDENNDDTDEDSDSSDEDEEDEN